MRIVNLKLKKHPYDIIIGRGILPRLGNLLKKIDIGAHAYIITNPTVKKHCAEKLQSILSSSGFSTKIKTIPDTEKSKSLETATAILKDIAKYDKRKRIFIVAFGGGVIGDVSGFVASIYKRGVSYIQIPTTLLAQVDSSIGGKTAVDLSEGKNLIGAFYHPRLVLSEISFLKTLNLRQLRSGLAEVIKYAAIKDGELFIYLEKKYRAILECRYAAMEFIIERCSRIKAEIVAKDEREEKGIRTILNFGHTIGHAIEAASQYESYNHGEAIALGMLVETEISKKLGLISSAKAARIEKLISAAGLPTIIKGCSFKSIIQAHHRDKKFLGKKNRFVLLTDIGRAKVVLNVPIPIIYVALNGRIKIPSSR
ncbi:MAG: 3-dehydroquinate synthase [Candidatus Omnitrophica bacterium]|nr:3-dehydroquinate synthase [Candidatus Omnitrophota bacterium]